MSVTGLPHFSAEGITASRHREKGEVFSLRHNVHTDMIGFLFIENTEKTEPNIYFSFSNTRK